MWKRESVSACVPDYSRLAYLLIPRFHCGLVRMRPAHTFSRDKTYREWAASNISKRKEKRNKISGGLDSPAVFIDKKGGKGDY